ncbi:MAG: phosphate signaling complex protein PhoU [Thermodesulfobacteriota bacterium]
MTKHLENELEQIKKRLLNLGAMTEDRLSKAVIAIRDLNLALAREIINTDYQVDELEVELEEECLKVIALYQPVASDLRFLGVSIKINNDLERIADEAVNMARRVKVLAEKEERGQYYDYFPMGTKVRNMLRKSLNAFVDRDSRAAKEVLLADEEIDALRDDIYEELTKLGDAKLTTTSYLLNFFLISRHLERVADHATNIAEEVIYMVEGENVRHVYKRKFDRTITE